MSSNPRTIEVEKEAAVEKEVEKEAAVVVAEEEDAEVITLVPNVLTKKTNLKTTVKIRPKSRRKVTKFSRKRTNAVEEVEEVNPEKTDLRETEKKESKASLKTNRTTEDVVIVDVEETAAREEEAEVVVSMTAIVKQEKEKSELVDAEEAVEMEIETNNPNLRDKLRKVERLNM